MIHKILGQSTTKYKVLRTFAALDFELHLQQNVCLK